MSGAFEGLHKVEFGTPYGTGAGVIWLKDGNVHGGDSSMYYVGTYSVSGDKITGRFIVKKHTSGQSVLGQDTSQVNFTGTITGTSAMLSGNPVGLPNVVLKVKLTPLS